MQCEVWRVTYLDHLKAECFECLEVSILKPLYALLPNVVSLLVSTAHRTIPCRPLPFKPSSSRPRAVSIQRL